MSYLLAQSNQAGGDLIQQSSQISTAVAQAFDNLWNITLSGGLYSSLCTVGVMFAIATLTFFIVEWTKNMLDNQERRAISDLIWPIVVVILMANNGQLLSQGTLALRNYINNTNNFVLNYTATTANLSAAFQQAVNMGAARSAISLAIQNCQNSGLEPQEQISCLNDAQTSMTQQYPEYFSRNSGVFGWMIDAIQRATQAGSDALNNGQNPLQAVFSSASSLVGSGVIEIIYPILLALNGAYQWAIELTMLTTALLGPIAVGSSLLPYGAKAIFTWLTGFLTVGMAKLSFNIITGLAGEIIAESKSDQPLFFLFVIGIFAPFLASGLAAGGGMSLLLQINKAGEMYATAAINIATGVATQGAITLAKKITPQEEE